MRNLLKSLSFVLGIVLLAGGLVVTATLLEKPKDTFETIDSRSKFLKIIEDYNKSVREPFYERFGSIAEDLAVGDEANSARDESVNPSSNSSADYSKTNTQVEGVDEADVVKTDGQAIYHLSQGRLLITTAYPLEEAGETIVIPYPETFQPSSLYVDDNHVIVIGSSMKMDESGYVYRYSRQSTVIYVYEKGHYDEAVTEYAFDGYQVSTRKIDDTLILVIQKYLPIHDETAIMNNAILPSYEVDGETSIIGYNEIHYQSQVIPNQLTTIFKINIHTKKVDHFSYLGMTDHVYMNESSIYLASVVYQFRILPAITSRSTETVQTTLVTKVDLREGLTSVGSVKVNGFINNQFMMDEYKGNFRITTTSGNRWSGDSVNNLYIYDANLNLIGKVEGLAKGETIQSTRFVGDRVYMVTFRQIDPFFVIDASDPINPVVLGELKIPGFSTYLHPYDENHVIGLGFEADPETGWTTGLKMALYEVSDPTHPIEKFKHVMLYEALGYSSSEVTYNHKALLFSKEKGIIAFPFNSTQYIPRNEVVDGINTRVYYDYIRQQFYKVFSIDLENGFDEQASISHFEVENGENSRWNKFNIDRGIYIDNYLYTVSPSTIQVHDLANYQKLLTIDLPYDDEVNHWWYR